MRGYVELLTKVQTGNYDPSRYLPEGILAEVSTFFRTLPTASVIAIHGWPGSGKTPTARWLGDKLGLPVVHLDEIRGTDGVGFDEEAARAFIALARTEMTVIVEGICASRVCSPDVLVQLGLWPGQSLTRRVREFIQDYDARHYSGTVRSFYAYDAGD
jgi:hypothetical protein